MYKYSFIFIIVLLFIGCNRQQSQYNVIDPTTFSDINQEAYLTGDELKNLIENNQDIILIDIRSISEYNESHLKGAIHIALKDLMNENTRSLISDSNAPVVLYGGTFEEIHGPFMLLNSLHDADLKILTESYANYMNPEINSVPGFDRAAFDFQKEWEDLLANTVIETPGGEIPNVANTRDNVLPDSKKVIPIIPKKKKAEEEDGC